MFSDADHYPIIAGYTSNGLPLYCAANYYQSSWIGIRNGTSLDRMQCREHYLDGTEKTSLLDSRESLKVLALKYDPDAYIRSKYYMNNAGDTEGMDPTGPFSWRFSKELPDIEPWMRVLFDELPVPLGWVEQISMEQDEEDILQCS